MSVCHELSVQFAILCKYSDNRILGFPLFVSHYQQNETKYKLERWHAVCKFHIFNLMTEIMHVFKGKCN